MAPSVRFYAWPSGQSTSRSASGVISLTTASAIAFGGGARSDFYQNLSLQQYNSSMHFAYNTAESTIDLCPSPHLWPLTPVTFGFNSPNRSTACFLSGSYIKMDASTPNRARGIGIYFVHTAYPIKCNPVYAWAGSGVSVSAPPNRCQFAIVDLSSSSPAWSTVKPSNKKTLVGRLTNATSQNWSIGVAVAPVQTGHVGDNKLAVEITYF